MNIKDMPIFAPVQCLEGVAVMTSQRSWTWRQVHLASVALAKRLEHISLVCNLCTSQLGFVITFLAALRCGATQIFPPSRGQRDLTAVLSEKTQATIIVQDVLDELFYFPSHCVTLELNPESEVPSPGSALNPNLHILDAQLAWSLSLDRPVLTLYTSGHTERPESKSKSLQQLITGAQLLGERIEGIVDGNGIHSIQALLSSVFPQHMFGIEASLMLSLVFGKPVFDQRPLLPADIQAALAACPPQTAWITTPLHMCGLVRAHTPLEHCSLVIASTMPLSADIAQQAEQLAQCPVLEIYGSTETGAIATRQTARDSTWQFLSGVQTVQSPGQDAPEAVTGSHFSSPQQLNDILELDPCMLGHFKLQGRKSDFIKVGGRRTSLATLNMALQELYGLDDGVFYLPDSKSPDQRLVMIYVSDRLGNQDLRAALASKIDPNFIPRTLIKVDRLPRGDRGKILAGSLAHIHAQWMSERKLEKKPC